MSLTDKKRSQIDAKIQKFTKLKSESVARRKQALQKRIDSLSALLAK